MLALDTNVILRFIDRTDARQTAIVERLVKDRDAGPFHISRLVLIEFAWTLKRVYRRPRAEIALWLRHLLEAPEFSVEEADLVERAVKAFEVGKADFADCLIGASNLAYGCATTLTFDGDALTMPDLFSPLPT
ncbi:type II toxin-antitoxin system VapC family toxin [Bosea sp. LjRoot90]|uniref:PIN domain-containing protein n=1 Tax=Bosea sp. LjRoot90 TaxID=3342342 RepID=UPI003ECEEC28